MAASKFGGKSWFDFMGLLDVCDAAINKILVSFYT